MHFLKLYVSHVVQRGLFTVGEKYYIYFVDSFYRCIQQWKNFLNWLTVDEVIAKMQQHVFWDTV